MTKDGTETTLEQALDLSHAEAEAVLESPNAAADYFPTPSTTPKPPRTVRLSSKRRSRPCVLSWYADTLSDTYGAVEALHSPDYDEYILQYDSQEAAQTAYDKLAEEHGQDHCFVDQLITQDDLLMDTGTSGAASCYSWGATLMGLDQLKAQAGNAVGDSSVTVAVLDTGFDAEHTFLNSTPFLLTAITLWTTPPASPMSPDLEPTWQVSSQIAPRQHLLPPAARVQPPECRRDGTGALHHSGGQYCPSVRGRAESRRDQHELRLEQFQPKLHTFLDRNHHCSIPGGIPICCAAGNESDDVKTSYPACNKNTIAVSSVNEDGSFDTVYSNYGSGIDFAAPGVDIVSAKSGGGVCKTGTSMATPHLTAAISYIKLRAPLLHRCRCL